MRKIMLLIGCSVATLPSVFADSVIRPGLWEVTTKSDLLQLIPHVPAEQMQQITRLAKQYGLEMPQISNGAANSTMCITPEMAKQEVPSYLLKIRQVARLRMLPEQGIAIRWSLLAVTLSLKAMVMQRVFS